MPNVNCVTCGSEFHVKPSRITRTKHKELTCSMQCNYEHRKLTMAGEKNHQYGLKGSKNSSFKSDTRVSSYGYELTRCLNHPFKNCDNQVFTHRLIAEKYLLTDDNSVEINGTMYLKPEYDVHHIDENRLNNNLSNLVVLTKSEHKSLHNKTNPQPRSNVNGRFIAQAEVVPVIQVDFAIVDELSKTVRGEGGFGHSGV